MERRDLRSEQEEEGIVTAAFGAGLITVIQSSIDLSRSETEERRWSGTANVLPFWDFRWAGGGRNKAGSRGGNCCGDLEGGCQGGSKAQEG